MIIQALCDYYNRLVMEPDNPIPRPGSSSAKISFALVLDLNGNLLDVADLRQVVGKKSRPVAITVPRAIKRTVKVIPNFLWDNTAYVLGADDKDKPKRALEAFNAFRQLAHEIGDAVQDGHLNAVLAFLDQWEPSKAPALHNWPELAGQNLVFRIDGELAYVHDRPAVHEAWLEHLSGAEQAPGQCLVTGNHTSIARIHAAIKGVRDAQSSGAALISFNLDAFTSYNKTQNYNAPVGEQAAFAYTTALNQLLSSQSRRKIQIGDATTVFWAERDSAAEDLVSLLFNPPVHSETDDVDGIKNDAWGAKKIYELLNALRKGDQPADIDPSIRFYLLGLSPNAARISVRFWHMSTVGELLERIKIHFDDLRVDQRSPKDPAYPPLWRLVRETAVQGKAENIPPAMAGALMRAVLTGGQYPQSLLTSILGRIRADKNINYLRASLIKACLVRKQRITNSKLMEVHVALNKDDRTPAYLLGRLFAVLEKAQKDAVPGANTTIKDRYYGSASATPRAVFPQMIRLAQHHIHKAEYGGASDRRMAEIMDQLDAFPAHLAMDQQGIFALGYYQQRNALYTKTPRTKEN